MESVSDNGNLGSFRNTVSVAVAGFGAYDLMKVMWCLHAYPGIVTHTLSKQRYPPYRFSRFCENHYCCPPEEDWLAFVVEMACRLGVEVLFPVSETMIRLVVENQRSLAGVVRLPALPSLDAFETVQDKWAFFQFAADNDLPVPRTARLTKSADLRAALVSGLSLPALLKPTRTTGNGQGISILRTLNDEIAISRHGCEWSEAHLLQEYIPGTDLCLCGYCRKGQILAYTIQQAVVTRGRFGCQRVIDYIEADDVVRLCARLVDLLCWDGMICVDLRRDDRNGQLVLIEVNPRQGRAVLGSVSAGVNFPLLACLDALGRPLPPMPYRRIRYYSPDAVSRAVIPLLARRGGHPIKTGLYYEWRDPLPRLVALCQGAAKASSRWWRQVARWCWP